ncbi:MAG: UDP-glucose 6-dehydrogenase [Candidatus Nealsonbacteria bacterium CG08_land_8_20_14_0_20_38_20]|uniref:UDP-glucose 6-dehydrogenase n=1 Tax=Candidatus Nealsonbacteria bacterium CG08_land_8_20_14_0_20_38_20 TaxID=1974705 RepID=A0A2H0YL04_9BACT|nr:MAG: UDP-glucose 6-dehydrogenase [Candidatus Nealsonbacteria bacterium CG08_land_8_20_14_0_20_38_20]
MVKKQNKNKIAIIGTGYVGLVTGACFADLGQEVTCLDKDKEKIAALKKGIIPIYEPGLKELVKRNLDKKRLRFSADAKTGIKKSDIIFICVGTPAKEDGGADLSYVEMVARDIANIADTDKIIVEKSTVPVNTAECIEKTLNLYKKNQVKFYVVSNPEFLREGSAINDFMNPDRIVLGLENGKVKETMVNLYSPIQKSPGCPPIIITCPKSAEIIKHASNSFLALKISYINLIAGICEKAGADVEEVALGMGLDKRINHSFLKAGLGYGGSCFPKDVKAFIKIAENLGMKPKLLEAIEEINQEQRKIFIEKIKEALWNLAGKTIGILGLSFKPNTDDMREAPSITIINTLLKEGAKVKAYDPKAMKQAKRIFQNRIKYCRNSYETAELSDALVIITEWEEFKNLNLPKIKKLLKIPKIIDGRNMFDPQKMKKLGFNYISIGRNI